LAGFSLQGTNISHQKFTFEDDFPFPKVGYVNSLEGIHNGFNHRFLIWLDSWLVFKKKNVTTLIRKRHTSATLVNVDEYSIHGAFGQTCWYRDGGLYAIDIL